jgi:hypothetical protein
MPRTLVFEMQNLYIPATEVYESEEFPIRIEPVKCVEEFEDNRREEDSKYQTGYWLTAKCFIEADEERAKELAEWLRYIYSFYQNRDVRWETYYPEHSPEKARSLDTIRIPVNNTSLRLVKAVHETGAVFNSNIGKLVDVALTTIDEADEELAADIRGSISLFLYSEGTKLMTPKFLLLWLVLEANADRNYHRHMKSQREYLFDEGEKKRIREYVLGEFADEFTEEQLDRLEHNLGKNFIFEPSTLVKIKKYAEQIDLGFDLDEVEEIVEESRGIRNQIVHSMNESGLRENTDILTDLRKMVMFLIMRELGVKPEWQDKLAMPQIFGPDSKHEW